jgi:hypothetical protein
MAVGEGFLGQVIDALRASPQWSKTLFIFTYDEHGGYYDHVPPPTALAPDSIQPVVNPGESTYDGYARYGFRVPAIVIGPYVKQNYVSSVVYDHTSILAFLERKWNLAAMTYRDANANDLTDFLDVQAMQAGQPTFPELPALVPAGDTSARLACSKTGPGTIPPPESVSHPRTQRLEIRSAKASRRLRGIVVEVRTNFGTMRGVELELRHGHKLLVRKHLAHIGTREHRVILRVHRKLPRAGRYTVEARKSRRMLARRTVTVPRARKLSRPAA